jgi:hypothetical protein
MLRYKRFVRAVFLGATAFVASAEAPADQSEPRATEAESLPYDTGSGLAFQFWLAFRPARAAEVNAFSTYLSDRGASGIFPVYQVLRSESSWRRCTGEPFVMPPREVWPHIVETLKFIRDRVIPVTGRLEVVSGYRSPESNACAGGASRSAHVGFWALDMIPLTRIDRAQMIAKLCAVHAAHGSGANVGLGFYNGMRFHIDTRSFRRWGVDRSGGSSPCAGITG